MVISLDIPHSYNESNQLPLVFKETLDSFAMIFGLSEQQLRQGVIHSTDGVSFLSGVQGSYRIAVDDGWIFVYSTNKRVLRHFVDNYNLAKSTTFAYLNGEAVYEKYVFDKTEKWLQGNQEVLVSLEARLQEIKQK